MVRFPTLSLNISGSRVLSQLVKQAPLTDKSKYSQFNLEAL